MGKQIIVGKVSAKTSRHLRWESFEDRIRQGPPSVERIKGKPAVELFIDPGGRRIGARFFTRGANAIANPLAELTIVKVGSGTQERLEVSASNPELFRDFYTFCCTVADKVQINGQTVEKSITETLASWAAIIRRRHFLSDEKQVGLFGELLFLRRAATSIGWPSAINGWQGPKIEEHDFTLPSIDVEIKATRAERRTHQISSLTQLVPKLGRKLFVVSIQLTQSTGKGSLSLPELVAAVLSAAITDAPDAVEMVRYQLKKLGWSDEDAPQYLTRYQLRSPMSAIPVDSSFPAVVPQTLSSLGPEQIARIENVSYAVNLDGLGCLDGTKRFNWLLFQRQIS